eukprot:gnl/TRDRNA2_/TRDRNA2_90516_c0_seq1.p1 gnl/TRDRNA2_/TRDRNA2_90516_c0~~gnl/TRDRNA2_/TRDRNA2_90516_c0_seq1.p1  ORF type:complete len:367 (+),score=36.75 gnl/TRDRNA2_/TRDRNA2_90516_c0_seq1:42-1103(+)
MAELLSWPFSRPSIHKASFDSDSPNGDLAWGGSCMQGWRDSMEDAHLALGSLGGRKSDWSGTSLFAVMDGHCGAEVAKFCEEHLPSAIASGPASDPGSALIGAFHRMDSDMRHLGIARERGGCTAVACCVRQDSIICANAGDCRALVCRQGQAVPLSEDHKPNIPGERDRISRAGGWVEIQKTSKATHFRVNGCLNVSRAIGDFQYKKNPKVLPCDQMVCSTPDIVTLQRDSADEFLVLACDGVWEMLKNQEVVDFIRNRLSHGAANEEAGQALLSGIAEDLLDRCLSPNLSQTGGLGGDNMTAIIVVLNGFGMCTAATASTPVTPVATEARCRLPTAASRFLAACSAICGAG